jgi:hypothetical protein
MSRKLRAAKDYLADTADSAWTHFRSWPIRAQIATGALLGMALAAIVLW